jgi:hypothetical protein
MNHIFEWGNTRVTDESITAFKYVVHGELVMKVLPLLNYVVQRELLTKVLSLLNCVVHGELLTKVLLHSRGNTFVSNSP